MSNFWSFMFGYGVATVVAVITVLVTRLALIKGENE